MRHEFGLSNWFGLKVQAPQPRDMAEIDYLVEGLRELPLGQAERVIAELNYMKGDTDGSRNPQDAPDLKTGQILPYYPSHY